MRSSTVVVLVLFLVSISGILALPSAKTEGNQASCVENCEIELVRSWITEGDDSLDQFTLVEEHVVLFKAADQNNCPTFELLTDLFLAAEGRTEGGHFYIRFPGLRGINPGLCEMTVWLPGAQLPEDQT